MAKEGRCQRSSIMAFQLDVLQLCKLLQSLIQLNRHRGFTELGEP
ncbi:hypothetical protein V5O39_00485 [Pseudomonas parakoreensis]